MRQHPGIAESAWALIGGIVLGAWWGGVWLFVIVGLLGIGLYAWRPQRLTALLVIVVLGAAWFVVRHERLAGDNVARFIAAESRLAQVVGVVESEPTFSSPWRGAMGRYHYQREPNTLTVLRVRSVNGEAASGRLLLRVREADHVIAEGLVIEATGWLSAIRTPANPGEWDYRQTLRDRGVTGQLSLATRGNWTQLGETRRARLELNAGDAAESALNLGMSDNPVRLALLQTLLLGRWSTDLAGVDDQFRQVGLAHILSISGAHLGILLGMVWLACRLMLIDPPRAAMVVMAVLLLFLMSVEPRVPIVRAGIMATIMCAAVWLGRRIDARHTLALAAIIVLLWRPGDLFSPGFQLSFLVVAALVTFTEPWLERLWPKVWIGGASVKDQSATIGSTPGARRIDLAYSGDRPPSAWALIGRWALGYVVVSAIAFCVAAPLVIYHYRILSPHAIVLSVLALPVVTLMLGLGYAKIAVGLVAPGASLVLAGPLRWASDALLGLVREAHGWPGVSVSLSGEPSVAWSAGWLALVWAFLAGRFDGRRAALAGAVVLMTAWTAWLNVPSGGTAASVHALAVGNGTCIVVRTPRRTMMFDCGSQRYFDVGLRSVNPALHRLGVRRIDVLVVSHSDIDHYCGVLDVADRVEVGRVWVTPQMIAEARADPEAAAAFLLNGLRDRGVPVEVVSRGYGEMGVDVLWPTMGYDPKVANDGSIVMRVDLAGRRLLLTGDIQQDAITRLLALGDDLRADVMELPHHGSIVDATGALLDAVRPTVVLQSCAIDRLRDERWEAILAGRAIERRVTARQGMIMVGVGRDGSLTVDTFTEAVYDDPGE